MGRASRRKQIPAVDRSTAAPNRGMAWWRSGRLVWWGGGLIAILAVGLLIFNGGRPAATEEPPHGQPAVDGPLFATTNGDLSLAGLRGSRVVIYFYEGVG